MECGLFYELSTDNTTFQQAIANLRELEHTDGFAFCVCVLSLLISFIACHNLFSESRLRVAASILNGAGRWREKKISISACIFGNAGRASNG